MVAVDLGCISYSEAFTLQTQAYDAVKDGFEDTVFFLEHLPTVSIGKHFGKENVPDFLHDTWHGYLDIVQSTRGGNITCHFPGQLVVYPILNIRGRKGGLRQYVYDLEETVIRVLARFDVGAQRLEGFPGVWTGEKKIASLGLAVSHHITMHGVALNVAENLSLFNIISPCGLNVEATSLALQLRGKAPAMDTVKSVFLEEFLMVFGLGVSGFSKGFMTKQEFLQLFDNKG